MHGWKLLDVTGLLSSRDSGRIVYMINKNSTLQRVMFLNP